MNYAETLRATALGPAGATAAVVFPAYGALAGVWVPRGTTELHVEAAPTLLPYAAAWRGLGLALLLAAAGTVVGAASRANTGPSGPPEMTSGGARSATARVKGGSGGT
jgi:hypothetical protein